MIPFLNAHNVPNDFIRVRKIIFVNENGKKEEVKSEDTSLAWILFDGIKKPDIFLMIANTKDMLKEMENYFEIKKK